MDPWFKFLLCNYLVHIFVIFIMGLFLEIPVFKASSAEVSDLGLHHLPKFFLREPGYTYGVKNLHASVILFLPSPVSLV